VRHLSLINRSVGRPDMEEAQESGGEDLMQDA